MKSRVAALMAVAALWGAGCTVHQSAAPGLTGPSEFATSILVTATPDRLNRDGASQSAVVVTARNPNGQPLAGLAVRLDMAVGGVLQDFGTLSARNLVTGSDGRAAAVYTAPAPPPAASAGQVSSVTIVASPVGSNAQSSPVGSSASSADILLTPVGVILPPADTPTPAFVVTPTPVSLNVAVDFDASASCAGAAIGGVCGSSGTIAAYSWNFGDGRTGSGKIVAHAYDRTGVFSVTLTVTNDRGVSASTSQAVTVEAGTAPTGDWYFSPTEPRLTAGAAVVQFNAEGMRAAAGKRIVEYSWDFGDGTREAVATATRSHTYDAIGKYKVVLTVTDDTGLKTTTAKDLEVK